MVKDGATRRGALGAFWGVAAAPQVMAAELAQDPDTDLVLPQSIFVAANLTTARAAGEAGTKEGVRFKAVGQAEGVAEVRVRTAAGSDRLYDELTKARLNGPSGAQEVGYQLPEEGARPRFIAEWIADQPVNVIDLGADREGADLSTDAFLKARDTGKNVEVPPGNYKMDTVGGILLMPGQEVVGPGGAIHSSSRGARIFNDEPGGGIFWYDEDTSTGTVRMPRIVGLLLQADYPIKFNNETTAQIHDGSPVPHGVKAGVERCDIRARIDGVGRGISLSKCFNWWVTDCEISRFDIDVLINGSDLGRLEHNRLWYAYSHHILEISSSTYGSQNEIRHNDILLASNPDCIFFKSNSLHTRFFNNYLEQSHKGAGTCKGFIDISTVNLPSYAGNKPLAQKGSVVIDDNRIDGHANANDFVYRVEPAGRTYISVRDVGTGGPHPVAPVLLLCAEAGDHIDEVPFLYNNQNYANFEFMGPGFGKWNGFRTSTNRSLRIDGANLHMIGYAALQANGVHNFLRARGNKIIIKPGFPNSPATLQMPIPQALEVFEPRKTYIVTFRARCMGSAQLSFARFEDGAGQTFANSTFTLTSKMENYSIEIMFGPGKPETANSGLHMRPSNNLKDEIELEYIEIRPKYAKEYAVMAYTDPVDINIGAAAGFVDVMAQNDPGTFVSRKRYAIVFGGLAAIASSETDPATISVSATLSGTTITATVTGSAGSKNLTVGHVLG